MPCFEGPHGIALGARSYAHNLLCELLHWGKGITYSFCIQMDSMNAFRLNLGVCTFQFVALDLSFVICKMGLLTPSSESHYADSVKFYL